MNTRTLVIVPELKQLLMQLGENLKLARLRRKLTTRQVSERAGITRTTLWQVEKGAPHVGIGAYAQVLFVLGLEEDLLKLANNDELGRQIQDAQLIKTKRSPKKR